MPSIIIRKTHSSLPAGNSFIYVRIWLNASFFSRKGHKEISKFLVEHGADLSNAMLVVQIMYSAVRFDDQELVVALVKKGVSPDISGFLTLSISLELTNMAITLIELGANINFQDVNGRTPLHHACEKRNIIVAKSLLLKGAAVDVTSYQIETPLLLSAAVVGNLDVVKLLVDYHANVNVTDVSGNSALLCAIDDDVKFFLIQNGANVHVENENGDTVLMSACRSGNLDLVKLLLSKSVDLDATNVSDGQTALLLACMNGYSEIVNELVQSGADVNLKDLEGFTSLVFVIENCTKETVTLLLESGAKVDGYLRNKIYFSAYIEGQFDMLELLRNHLGEDPLEFDKDFRKFVLDSLCSNGDSEALQNVLDLGFFDITKVFV